MPSDTVSIPSMLSDSQLTRLRHPAARSRIPNPMVARLSSSGCTATMGNMRKWIAAQSSASIGLWPMSGWPTTVRCGKCFTTTSPGRPRQLCPATFGPLAMCLPVSPSHGGHGTDSSGKTRRLTSVSCPFSEASNLGLTAEVPPPRQFRMSMDAGISPQNRCGDGRCQEMWVVSLALDRNVSRAAGKLRQHW